MNKQDLDLAKLIREVCDSQGFKVEITEEYTKLQGNVPNLLTALACFIQALKQLRSVPDDLIKTAIELGLKKGKKYEN